MLLGLYLNNEYDAERNRSTVSPTAKIIDSVIIQPCYIGENAVLERSVIGPHVSVGDNTKITDSNIKNSIIQHNTTIKQLVAKDSMIGSHAEYKGLARDLSISDYSQISE